ncbi:APC family permease [Sphingobium amiense]|uniref:APC family permease n=2 Tax=Sphingobium amiense TaxID=135719 RepID=A0A494W3J6_9SPHN|nr:APC family permease [Sphingobium amiense]
MGNGMAISETVDMVDGNAADAQRPVAGKLHKQLTTWGCLFLAMSGLSPALSVFGIGSDVLLQTGSAAAPLFLLSIGVAVIWGTVYAELGSAYPYAGGDYVGVGTILGAWAAAVTLAIWATTLAPLIAFEAKAFATYINYVLPDVSASLLTGIALAASVGIALLAVRAGAWVTGVFLLIEMLAIVALGAAGLLHSSGDPLTIIANPVVAGPEGLLVAPTLAALALGGVNAAYATIGGNQALYFGEELIDPHKAMGRVVLIACFVGAFAIAVPMVLVVLGAPDLGAILRSPAPLATFLTQTLGSGAGKLISVCIALAIFNAMIVQIMLGARLYFSLGRDGVFSGPVNRFLNHVSHKSGVPRRATLVLAVFSALCCLASAHALLVFMSGLLVYAWGLVCLAVLIGRLKGKTGQDGYWRAPFGIFAPVLGLALALVFAIAKVTDEEYGRPSLIIMGGITIAAVFWSRLILEKRPGGWTPTLVDHS